MVLLWRHSEEPCWVLGVSFMFLCAWSHLLEVSLRSWLRARGGSLPPGKGTGEPRRYRSGSPAGRRAPAHFLLDEAATCFWPRVFLCVYYFGRFYSERKHSEIRVEQNPFLLLLLRAHFYGIQKYRFIFICRR